MKIIPFDQLAIPSGRQRQEFNPKKLQDLANSIMSKGLMHPLVVRQTESGFELVAGERRSRAIRSISELSVSIMCNNELIPANHFPAILLSDLSPYALKEAELEENLIREPLTWQEQAAAVADLDELRRGQAQETGERHTTRAVASEILGREAVGSEITKVSETLAVAKHLDDPDVAKAKTVKEALKVVKKKAEEKHRAVLAEQFNPQATPHKAAFGSCFDYAPSIPDSTFDIILTDPPYGIGADDFGDMAGTEHSYADTLEYAMKCYELVAVQGFRVAKPQAHAYVFLDPRYFDRISLLFTMAGWEVWPTPLIWDKNNGMLPKPEYGPRRTYEMILFSSKGGKKVLKVAPDVLRHSMVSDRAHGAQKPVSLYVDLLSRSAYPGMTVVDFFSGSGTIFPAANRCKLSALGFEQVRKYYDLGLSRINSTEELEELDQLLPGGE